MTYTNFTPHYITAVHERSTQTLIACACGEIIWVDKSVRYASTFNEAWNNHRSYIMEK